ncbi:MAG: hypothetical protein HC886_11520 [Leptolyngbyaceae cyanobacterium SM1_1_3]|nr:hypothetical protein [Leptolyngbyaceae cyanobacterium SM1_1_3]
MLYQIYEWGQQGKVDSDLYLRVIEKLRTKYFSQEHPKKFSYFDTSVISVAVHIRRDDASVENQRFLPISYYKKLLSNLSKILADKPHEFHVYSSGLDREMEEIQKELNPVSSQLRYHPNESAMEAIHHMAIADILVVGNSSFSHWPGFLSSGIKLYHPHFHMFNLDENEWVEVKEDSSFNESHFISLLSSSQKGIDFSDTHAKLQAQ